MSENIFIFLIFLGFGYVYLIGIILTIWLIYDLYKK